jgi:hypothetical protein
MIFGGLAAGVRILLEKSAKTPCFGRSGKIPKKYQKIIFRQKTEVARRRRRVEQQGGLTTRGHGPTPGRAGLW